MATLLCHGTVLSALELRATIVPVIRVKDFSSTFISVRELKGRRMKINSSALLAQPSPPGPCIYLRETAKVRARVCPEPVTRGPHISPAGALLPLRPSFFLRCSINIWNGVWASARAHSPRPPVFLIFLGRHGVALEGAGACALARRFFDNRGKTSIARITPDSFVQSAVTNG